MNQEKLKKLQAQVRIGGKGTPRRKKKIVRVTAAPDERKFQTALRKLSLDPVQDIEEANVIKDDGTVIHFKYPDLDASFPANTFAISGYGEKKQITELLPEILSQLGPESSSSVANSATGGKTSLEEDDGIPDLVENFDEASKEEVLVNVKEKEGRGKENDQVAGDKLKGKGKKKGAPSADSKDKHNEASKEEVLVNVTEKEGKGKEKDQVAGDKLKGKGKKKGAPSADSKDKHN